MKVSHQTENMSNAMEGRTEGDNKEMREGGRDSNHGVNILGRFDPCNVNENYK